MIWYMYILWKDCELMLELKEFFGYSGFKPLCQIHRHSADIFPRSWFVYLFYAVIGCHILQMFFKSLGLTFNAFIDFVLLILSVIKREYINMQIRLLAFPEVWVWWYIYFAFLLLKSVSLDIGFLVDKVFFFSSSLYDIFLFQCCHLFCFIVILSLLKFNIFG